MTDLNRYRPHSAEEVPIYTACDIRLGAYAAVGYFKCVDIDQQAIQSALVAIADPSDDYSTTSTRLPELTFTVTDTVGVAATRKSSHAHEVGLPIGTYKNLVTLIAITGDLQTQITAGTVEVPEDPDHPHIIDPAILQRTSVHELRHAVEEMDIEYFTEQLAYNSAADHDSNSFAEQYASNPQEVRARRVESLAPSIKPIIKIE